MKLVQSFLRGHTIYALILLLAIFVIGVEAVRPGTVNPLWASNTILFAAPLAIMAGGQTLVMLTGGIDLSVASVATGAAYLLATNASAGSATAIGIALLLGLLVGIINGIGVALLRVQPLVMTLGTGLMTGGVLIVYSQHMLASQPHVPDIIQTLGAGRVFGLVPIDLFLWLIIAALILFGLQRTGFGRLLYAVGDNREACHLAGVRVWRVLFVNYVLCAILAAIAGLVVVGGTNAADLGSLRGHRRHFDLRRTRRLCGDDYRRAGPDRSHRSPDAARRLRADQADPLRGDHPLARRGLCAPDGVMVRLAVSRSFG
jgi:ribose transport system permease protein